MGMGKSSQELLDLSLLSQMHFYYRVKHLWPPVAIFYKFKLIVTILSLHPCHR
jgi:hypothetical protein